MITEGGTDKDKEGRTRTSRVGPNDFVITGRTEKDKEGQTRTSRVKQGLGGWVQMTL